MPNELCKELLELSKALCHWGLIPVARMLLRLRGSGGSCVEQLATAAGLDHRNGASKDPLLQLTSCKGAYALYACRYVS